MVSNQQSRSFLNSSAARNYLWWNTRHKHDIDRHWHHRYKLLVILRDSDCLGLNKHSHYQSSLLYQSSWMALMKASKLGLSVVSKTVGTVGKAITYICNFLSQFRRPFSCEWDDRKENQLYPLCTWIRFASLKLCKSIGTKYAQWDT